MQTGGSGSGPGGAKKWGDTTSKKGEICRVFVGNTDPKLTTCEDLENKFSAYGKIQGIDINPSGFSFVQFASIPEAQRAVNGENGTMLRGRKLEVRMFEKSGPPKRKNPNRDRSRSPLPPRGPPAHGGHGGHGGLPLPPHGPPGYGVPGAPPVPGGPPPPPPPAAPGNDIEIIVVNKDQWGYAEMIERTLRQETPIKYIDLLFLHSPQHITMTLNDLYERRTLYAIVVTPVNEEHKSITLHILHSQTEHRNIPLEGAIDLINQDFRAFMARRAGPEKPYDSVPFRTGAQEPAGLPPRGPGLLSNGSTAATYSTSVAASVTTSGENRLPDEISYLLRTTLSEGGVQFLSLQQIDSIIEYFSRERDRLTSQARQQQLRTQADQGSYNQSYGQDQYQQVVPASGAGSGSGVQPAVGDAASNLLDNPHVKAALNSLLQIGAIGNSGVGGPNANLNSLASTLVGSYSSGTKTSEGLQVTSATASTSEAPSYLSTSAPSNVQSTHQMMSGGAQQSGVMNQNLRRHPLLGTEIGSTSSAMSSYPGMSGMQMRSSATGSNHRGYPSGGQRY